MVNKIKKIGEEMAKQNNMATQYVMFVVQELVERMVPAELADGRKRKSEIGDYSKEMCEECLKKWNDDEELSDDCTNCDEDCFYYYENSWEFNLMAGVFLTAKACEEHIEKNSYHYSRPRSYGISAWRNFEMQEVMKFLITNSGNKVPSHYL